MTARPAPPPCPVRQAWLDRWREEIIDPDLPIVDRHHHLWDRPGWLCWLLSPSARILRHSRSESARNR